MEKKIERPQTLAIDGKVINIFKIAEKTLAQFKQQLKQNGLTIDDARAEKLYIALAGGKSDEELQAMIDAADEQSK